MGANETAAAIVSVSQGALQYDKSVALCISASACLPFCRPSGAPAKLSIRIRFRCVPMLWFDHWHMSHLQLHHLL